jgi:hypothetical protein
LGTRTGTFQLSSSNRLTIAHFGPEAQRSSGFFKGTLNACQWCACGAPAVSLKG